MRLLGFAVPVVAGLVPAVADACSTSDCYRWTWLETTRVSYPRDAAITLSGSPIRQVCSEDLRRFASVVVRRGDEVVPGSFELPVGLIRGLVWYPDEPLAPDVYAMTVEVDNAALDVLLGVPEHPFGQCQPDAFIQDLEFTVVDEPSPSAPVVPPPRFEIESRWHDTSFKSLACCAGSEPFEAIGGDCERTLYGFDCTYLYDYDYLTVSSATFPSTDEYDGLWLYQLVVDGEVVARGTTPLAVRHNERACAHLEAIHFGTGEVVASEAVCPPAELAVGPTTHAPQDEPTCALLACGTDDRWEPENCQAYDGVNPPFEPAPPMPSETLTTRCDAPQPAAMPIYPELPDVPEIRDRGCGCASTPTPGPWVIVIAGLLRRRRRARGQRCVPRIRSLPTPVDAAIVALAFGSQVTPSSPAAA